MKFHRITVNPKQMGGVPCMRGLRIPVATVVGMVADGMNEKESLKLTPIWKKKTSKKRWNTLQSQCVSVNCHWLSLIEVSHRQSPTSLKAVTES